MSVEKISILCPTRGRPENVIRLIESIKETTTFIDQIELLFYVDNDDATFPLITNYDINIILHTGPRLWMSNSYNFLSMNATGNIFMTIGDDMVFKTVGWDQIVRESFDKISDKICIFFGNDLGAHAGNIATHLFIHRKWVERLGTLVQPGRGSLWDLWCTHNARIIGRLFYLDNLIIEHLHYRQSSKKIEFDATYAHVRASNLSFRPEVTYRRLERERRIDRLLLVEAMNEKPKIESKYLFSEIIVSKLMKTKNESEKMRILTLSNFELVKFIFLRFFFSVK